MFVGHYAAAMAAKSIEPKAPMWALIGAAQLVDIGWAVFIMTGVERASIDPSLPGSKLVLEHMPWTHSLPMTLLWSLGAAMLVRLFLRLPVWASTVVGFTVLSHWAFDWLVHRPDLELWIGGPRVGLALWNQPVLEQALEIGLLAVCGGAWVASRKTLGHHAWPAILFIALLVTLQIVVMILPQPAGPLDAQAGVKILAIYLMVAGVAALTERLRRRA